MFDRFSGLAGQVPWMQLGSFPTPVEKITGLDYDNLWIKRDDLSSGIYGGNKIRKLEFIMADVQRKDKSHVVTMGGIGTNHGLATAAFCRELDIRCTLLLFKQPVTSYVQNNLRLFRHFNAELDYKGSLFNTALSFYTSSRLRYPGAYFLFAGGSTPLGSLGFVNAVFELKKQIQEGLLPEPDIIICPLGSNGTLAGLSLGVKLAGLKSQVKGVRVTAPCLGPIPASTPKIVLQLMKETLKLLRKADSSIPSMKLTEEPLIIDEFFGDGYGCATEQCIEVLDEVKEKAGIKLDPCYTAKTFAAVKKQCESKEKQKVLYWHTYNSVDLTDAAGAVNPEELPLNLRKFLEEEPLL